MGVDTHGYYGSNHTRDSIDVDCPTSCSSLIVVLGLIQLMQYVPAAGALIYIHCPIVAVPADFPEVFSALRTYVLSQSKLLGLLVFTLSLGPVAANLVSTSQRIEPVG